MKEGAHTPEVRDRGLARPQAGRPGPFPFVSPNHELGVVFHGGHEHKAPVIKLPL